MTEDELKAIEERQARRRGSVNFMRQVYGREVTPAEHVIDIETLLTEVRRLRRIVAEWGGDSIAPPACA